VAAGALDGQKLAVGVALTVRGEEGGKTDKSKLKRNVTTTTLREKMKLLEEGGKQEETEGGK